MTEPLTPRQKKVLDFLIDHISSRGFPPTVREIGAHLGISGPKGAKKFLDILERKGYIRRFSKSSRAIEVLHPRLQEGVSEDADYREAKTLRPQVQEGMMVPVVGRIRAGSPILAVENLEGEIPVDPFLAKGKELFFLRVEGDSMIDAHIQDGDYALIRSQPTAHNGEIVAVLIGEEATLKRFYKQRDRVVLRPANARMEPIVLTRERPPTILGKLVAVFRTYERE
ncbi:MAG: transcriptional repressor LexA [bacterium]